MRAASRRYSNCGNSFMVGRGHEITSNRTMISAACLMYIIVADCERWSRAGIRQIRISNCEFRRQRAYSCRKELLDQCCKFSGTQDASIIVYFLSREEEINFALRVLVGCRCVDNIFADRRAIQVADRVRSSLFRISGTNHLAQLG